MYKFKKAQVEFSVKGIFEVLLAQVVALSFAFFKAFF